MADFDNLPVDPPAVSPGAAFMTEAELAQWMGVSPQTTSNWRKRGIGPPSVLVSEKIIHYPTRGVREWLARKLTPVAAE